MFDLEMSPGGGIARDVKIGFAAGEGPEATPVSLDAAETFGSEGAFDSPGAALVGDEPAVGGG